MTYLQTRVWACEPVFLARGQALLLQALQGRAFQGAELHAALGVAMPEARLTASKGAKAADVQIAVIPIQGVIESHASSLGTSAREIQGMLRQALGSKQVDGILFDVDSPGGVVTGVPELADEIRESKGIKPMASYNSGMMASAAYWLGAAAGDVTAAPSSQTGSIGVYTLHEDMTGFLEKEGIKLTEISRGEFKTEMAPWKALSEVAQAQLDTEVAEVYDWFIKSVAMDRKATQTAVREGYGRGRVLMAEDALAANLIDRVGTFDDALFRLAKKLDGKPAGARADLLRRRMALDAARVGE
jgi:signal peptide peptidase SppA